MDDIEKSKEESKRGKVEDWMILNGNRIAEIEVRLYKLENEEFCLEMNDMQSEAEKTRLRGIRQELRILREELKRLTTN